MSEHHDHVSVIGWNHGRPSTGEALLYSVTLSPVCIHTPSILLYMLGAVLHQFASNPCSHARGLLEAAHSGRFAKAPRLNSDEMVALQVKGKWRAQYARYGNKGIVVLAILMALTGVALILAGMQQPKAPVILPGGGTGPSRNELRAGALQEARKAAKQKSSLTSGCPMLRVPKVGMAALNAVLRDTPPAMQHGCQLSMPQCSMI